MRSSLLAGPVTAGKIQGADFTLSEALLLTGRGLSADQLRGTESYQPPPLADLEYHLVLPATTQDFRLLGLGPAQGFMQLEELQDTARI